MLQQEVDDDVKFAGLVGLVNAPQRELGEFGVGVDPDVPVNEL